MDMIRLRQRRECIANAAMPLGENLPVSPVPPLSLGTTQVAGVRVVKEDISRLAHVLSPVPATVPTVAAREAVLAQLHLDENDSALAIFEPTPQDDVDGSGGLVLARAISFQLPEQGSGGTHSKRTSSTSSLVPTVRLTRSDKAFRLPSLNGRNRFSAKAWELRRCAA